MGTGGRRAGAVTVVIVLCALFATGCAQRPTRLAGPTRAAPEQACARYFERLDAIIHGAGVNDAGAAPVTGFPYLRVNRFLASFEVEPLQAPAFTAWVDRLRRLDALGRRIELANLPSEEASQLPTPPEAGGAEAAIMACARQLRRADLGSPQGRARLRQAATVPDEYRTAWRVLGLYPLTSLFVSMGIARWHEETRQAFAVPLSELPAAGKPRRYSPPPRQRLLPSQVANILRRSAASPLGIPEPSRSERKRLFDTFAPVWEIDTVDENDQIGSPVWRPPAASAQVDTDQPAVYRRLSHTRFSGRILLQLNYVIWFPSRPPAGALDIYAGHLDGINWRVTLDVDGRPLLYDAIHNCGCYHMLFPTARLRLRSDFPPIYFEPPLLPQRLGTPPDGVTTVVHIAHRTHYLQRVQLSGKEKKGIPYAFRDYAQLRSLPLPRGGRRSLFGPSGIVQGTARAERWLLWPMGIPAPGAMRQWGHHAVAFVGRRHFDDPDLLGQLFEPAYAEEAIP